MTTTLSLTRRSVVLLAARCAACNGPEADANGAPEVRVEGASQIQQNSYHEAYEDCAMRADEILAWGPDTVRSAWIYADSMEDPAAKATVGPTRRDYYAAGCYDALRKLENRTGK
jgi:hypothetical protein